MDVAQTHSRERFQVLQTTGRSQTAMMTLRPGEASSREPNTHENSDQVLLLLEGRVEAEVEGERRTMNRGDVVTVPAGARHKFTNTGDAPAVTFNVYSPPAY